MIVVYAVLILGALVLAGLATSVRILKQYERGVQFRLGAFLSRENAAAAHTPPAPSTVPLATNGDATRA